MGAPDSFIEPGEVGACPKYLRCLYRGRYICHHPLAKALKTIKGLNPDLLRLTQFHLHFALTYRSAGKWRL